MLSVRYLQVELEFLTGAMIALIGDAAVSCPPVLVIAGMRGDPFAV